MAAWVYVIATAALGFAFLMYSPTLLDINPKACSLPFPAFEGPLKENYLLNDAEILFKDVLLAPESMAFHGGYLYTGLIDGRIVKVKGKDVVTVAQTGRFCEMPYEERLCGRPLGMRIGKDGLLYVIDAFYGLFTMNLTTELLTQVLPSSVKVEGQHLNFPDDLDIDNEGSVYFSDASTKWDQSYFPYALLEHAGDGRVIRYNLKSRETEVLAKNLYFPNGVQLSKDGKSLLISETFNRRILRYHLKGKKKGQTEVFADTLPAEPDNIRSSPRGYWVGLTSARNNTNYLFLDTLNSYPTVKFLWARAQHSLGTLLVSLADITSNPVFKEYAYRFRKGDLIWPLFQSYGMVVELDENGKILRSLHSPDGKLSDISQAEEHGGYLYLGSYSNPYLGRLKL